MSKQTHYKPAPKLTTVKAEMARLRRAIEALEAEGITNCPTWYMGNAKQAAVRRAALDLYRALPPLQNGPLLEDAK